MLPPVLETYVVWHPDDAEGACIADGLLSHFNESFFDNLLGGAVSAYPRSAPWRHMADAPRPIPFPGSPLPEGLAPAEFTAVVLVLGFELEAAVESGRGPWWEFLCGILKARESNPRHVLVLPTAADGRVMFGTQLARMFGRFQAIGMVKPRDEGQAEAPDEARRRDLTQTAAQFVGGDAAAPVRIFLSHTYQGYAEQPEIDQLVDCVRLVLRRTRLDEFFDANSLQAGGDWRSDIREAAASAALLGLRTDRFPQSRWCQEEVADAKGSGMSVVFLDALLHGEERGSFLLDHVPRLPVRRDGDGVWRMADVRRAVNMLVDEHLKRVVWNRQKELALDSYDVRDGGTWWAPHAPEYVTFVAWRAAEIAAGRGKSLQTVRIIHPDPPLGPREKRELGQAAVLMGIPGGLDITTAKHLAARGAEEMYL